MAQMFGIAAKTGLQIRAPVPPHLTAAAFIFHDEFKDDTLEHSRDCEVAPFFFRARINL